MSEESSYSLDYVGFNSRWNWRHSLVIIKIALKQNCSDVPETFQFQDVTCFKSSDVTLCDKKEVIVHCNISFQRLKDAVQP